MSKIGILVDSTSGITHEFAKEYGNMHMIPLYFLFGDETYEDGVDLTLDEFFQKSEELYEKTKKMPTTSQPSVGRTLETFEGLLKEYDHVIYMTLSSKMSGTYQSGLMASKEFEDKVTVIDSTYTVSCLRQMAICASEDAKAGKSVEEIVKKINYIIDNTTIYFVVSDLKHLQRTGRIGAAASVIGTALQLKPILEVRDGEVATKEKIRSLPKALKGLCKSLEELNLNEDDCVYVLQAVAEEMRDQIAESIKEINSNIDVKIDVISPVIAVNTGPGIAGCIVIKGLNKL